MGGGSLFVAFVHRISLKGARQSVRQSESPTILVGRKAVRTLLRVCVSILMALLFATATRPPLASAYEQAQGMGSYLLGPGMPTIFTFDHRSMLCSVSWGTLGAPGPGPFSDPDMHLDKVNFGMVVFSLEVRSFNVTNNRVTMTGSARSITTMNQWVVENAIYDFKVEAVDGGPPARDSFSLTLEGWGLMFDGHSFRPAGTAGLVSGDIIIRP